MVRSKAIALAGLLVLACTGASLAVPQSKSAPPSSLLPDPGHFVEQAQSAKLNPETFDFAATGFLDQPQSQRMQWQIGVFAALKAGQPDAAPACSTVGQRNGVVMTWTQIAVQSTDATEWKATATTIRARLAQIDQILRKSAPATPSPDPLVQELLLRYARDQDVRSVFSQRQWTEGLPPTGANNWAMAVLTRMSAIDCDNTAWLEAELPKVGWFTIPKYGEAADTAAWALTQHADLHPEFQRAVLDKLQALPPGQTDRKRIGFLFDRVARAEGRQQRYGTQGVCKDESWVPHPVEDPEHLDERRASLGMKPESEAIAKNSGECPH